jgi:hypothetical protein
LELCGILEDTHVSGRTGVVADPLPAEAVLEQAARLLKVATDILSNLKPQGDEQRGKTAGPLQIAGRLYLSLTAILALSATGWSYLFKGTEGATCSTVVATLRWLLVAAIFLGITGILWLVAHLTRKHVSLLSGPGEYSSTVHEALMSKGDPLGSGPPDSVTQLPGPAGTSK